MHHVVAPSIISSVIYAAPAGYTGYKPCYQEVLKVVNGIIHQPFELEDNTGFYAFSYYYDEAVDAGLIGWYTHTQTPLT